METLDKLFESFETGIRNGKAVKPKEYLKTIGLDYNELRIGFNSGQFHHRDPQVVKDQYEAMGLLKKSNVPVNKDGLVAYTVFGKYGIVFPLLNQQNKIVNFFAIRFEMKTPIEEYLNNDGVYPKYPSSNTKRLYITQTLLDCASLLQSKALENKEAVMALHNGELLPQHVEAIKSLHDLEEIILIKN